MPAPQRLARLVSRLGRAAMAPAACAALACAAAQAADPPALLFPVRCEIGRDCWVFAYMDLQSGPGYRDPRCGLRTYEGHKGTDIAPVEPGARLPVIAAAGGVVAGIRDGMDDSPMRGRDPDRDAARCGNGVRLDHGGGWTTQYCHLQSGSVQGRRGERVSAGDLLGRTGSSGWSELPHLHFQVERDGRPVDPFTGAQPADPPGCEARDAGRAGKALWRASDYPAGYAPTIIHRAGLTTAVPDKQRALHEGYPQAAPATAPALIGYAVLLGAFAGATVDTTVTGPDGRVLFRHRRSIDQDRARHFSYAGKRRKTGAWTPGVYRARFVVSGESPAGPFRSARTAEIALR